MAIFLGIDPGLATIGFGVIEEKKGILKAIDWGVFRTPAGAALQDRLLEIKNDFDKLLTTVKPDAVGVEELFFAKNVTNAIKVAHARGVILERTAHHAIPLFEFTPLQVKNNICGYGQADKIQLQRMVQKILKLSHLPKPDDAADALAMALYTERLFKR